MMVQVVSLIIALDTVCLAVGVWMVDLGYSCLFWYWTVYGSVHYQNISLSLLQLSAALDPLGLWLWGRVS